MHVIVDWYAGGSKSDSVTVTVIIYRGYIEPCQTSIPERF